MFVSVQEGARVERAEVRLSSGLAAEAIRRGAAGAFVAPIAGGVAVYAGAQSPVNKLIGVGYGGALEVDALEAIETRFARLRAPLQAEVSTLADPAVYGLLSRRGYVLQGFEAVLGRPIAELVADVRPPDRVALREVGEDELAAWLDVAITGFQHPDAEGVPAEALPPREVLESALKDCLGAPGFRRFAATVDGALAGVATLRVDEGVAQLCGAATLPAFRRRGIQSALLGHRLAEAGRAGCDLAVMTTMPGSKSNENGCRQGFQLLFCRALLVKSAE